MNNCTKCKKKATQKRLIETNGQCNECNALEIVDENESVGSISFGQFRKWIKHELDVSLSQAIKEELKAVSNELAHVKKENANLKAKAIVQDKELAKINDKYKELQKCCDNNLKYLINLDRNERSRNVLIFGVTEKESLNITVNEGAGETQLSADDDVAKIDIIMRYIKADTDNKIADFFRLGKENDKPRPIKLKMVNKEIAYEITRKSKLLKNLGEGTNIYIKNDKSNAERLEFQRLGKRKADLINDNPKENDQQPDRVILKKRSSNIRWS